MGTDIHVFREILINGKWECIEPTSVIVYDDKVKRHPESMDIWRDYTLFNMISEGVRGDCIIDSIQSYPKGLPDNVSNELSHIKQDGASCYNISYLTYKEIDDYLEHWKQDLIDTEHPIYDFWNDEDLEKIERFNTSARKKTREECLEFYLKMWESNILLEFRKRLDESEQEKVWFNWQNERYKSLKDFPTTDKRIIFYFDC